ncbi:dynein regulatory complex protein 8 [Tachysurus fulvidraco]|uniref:dynein regulatory complex protein 8 n=1 Tax=Tachysurus fulvidraco TaxID=1234273 RepID=UPI000F4FDE61|nr:dynein regulatory complex protein 8 [Tachysurus fulvidraco]
MADDKDSAGAVVTALQRRISSVFDVFDHESNHTVDIREIGTIIRSLGCFPTEAELHDIIAEIEEEEATGFIQFEKFLPVMTKILMDNKFRPIPEDLLLQAFEVLDQQKNGHLEPEELTKYLTQEGEPFSHEEMEEMLSAALDPDKQVVFYREFVGMMTLDDSR